MNRSLVALVIIGIVLVLGAIANFMFFPRESQSGKFDAFAQCLAENKITMYGADWCPHCQNEKKAFGDSFRFVPYVECPQDPDRCIAAGIKRYPTWIFPASPAGGPDGRRLEGEQGLEKLSSESSCALPN
ncbi:MAG: hypothetical protein A3B25_01655 [Candidatus Ryanbacteria bacterium RIFCSPLOWO2_01_FULL_48_26]|uniref:Thioredoxin domain-containing protein n=1 Tax=Candidatus Ryanbacteria bacterium RIFCSPLOWO2_01_FULL_48_26 TaxID=1802126 RepID=A0A1G2GX07_9BACT|nr:MAG: hypothetical protein A3B25_01655 [Candidatus Ryanbacteria bacterium RIFCSPLOWO2_01_FULL_48_26]